MPSGKKGASWGPGTVDLSKREEVQREAIAIYRHCFGDEEADEDILELDPGDDDEGADEFYELVEERFGVAKDPEDENLGGFGGTVEELVDHLVERWDGELRDVSEDYGYQAAPDDEDEDEDDLDEDDEEDDDEVGADDE